MPPTSPLLSTALAAARAAGRDIMSIYNDPSADFGVELKADNSPLTRADKAAHARILSFLEPTGIPVLSEEGAHLPYSVRRTWRRLWVVDPLDGTKEFIKRNGEFTVNIALVEDGVPVMGVILRPAPGRLTSPGRPTPNPSRQGGETSWQEADAMEAPLQEAGAMEVPLQEAGAIYFGSKEAGAWRADVYEDSDVEQILRTAQPLPHSSRRPPLPDGRGMGVGLVCVASRSHLSPETEAFINDLRREHPDLELISSGSSLKICLVAEGRADVYPRHAPTMEWDTAAGDAIARAAGCQVIDAHTGQPLTYNKEDLHNPWFIVRR